MMLLLLHKKLHSSYYTALRFSTLQTQNPCPKPSFTVQYLINSCGFSLDMANKASKLLPQFDSPSKPDSIIHFLSQNGFSQAHINQMVTKQPRFLCCDLDKTLKPNFKSLQELGFTERRLRKLLLESPSVLNAHDLTSKVEFYKPLFGTYEKLLKAFRRDQSLLTCRFDRKAMPNISILRQCGIQDQFIGDMLLHAKFIGKKPSLTEDVVNWADQFGVSRSSKMFGHVVKSLLSINRANFYAKRELFKEFGFAEADFIFMFKRLPTIASLSEQNIGTKMEFLVKEVRMDTACIAKKPFLFSYSLKKRLIPWYNVWMILKWEGLKEGQRDIWHAFNLKESVFVDKFILQHMDKVPGLLAAYGADMVEKVFQPNGIQEVK